VGYRAFSEEAEWSTRTDTVLLAAVVGLPALLFVRLTHDWRLLIVVVFFVLVIFVGVARRHDGEGIFGRVRLGTRTPCRIGRWHDPSMAP